MGLILKIIAAAQIVAVLAQADVKPRTIDFASDWVGPDGPWAAYVVTLASQEDSSRNSQQPFRMFPGFSLPYIMAPRESEFCLGDHRLKSICLDRDTLHQNLTWSCQSNKTAEILAEFDLEKLVSPNSTQSIQMCGKNNVELTNVDSKNGSDPAWTNQGLASISSIDFVFGIFGLSNATFAKKNQTAYMLPGPIELRLADFIPSNSFSYTAGSYQRNQTPPSLVLGGYDISRINPNTTFQQSFKDTNATSNQMQLKVNISSISLSQQGKLLKELNFIPQNSLTMYIDPITPYIWLPISVCESFEAAFGIQWDELSQLYLISSSTRDRLLRLDPQVNFTLGYGLHVERTFTLPYSAFDLNVTYPFVETESYYFPLKRATSDHFVLGRAFLQETLVSVDYDSGLFNISQVAWMPNIGSKIVPIVQQDGSKKKLPNWAIVSIGVAVAIAVIFVLGPGSIWLSSLWPSNTMMKNASPKRHDKAELHGAAQPWVELMPKERHELEGKECSVEVAGSQAGHEMDAGCIAELGGLEIVRSHVKAQP